MTPATLGEVVQPLPGGSMDGKVSVQVHLVESNEKEVELSERMGIVTPEAVVLDFETAGIGSRGAARLLDGLIQGVALLIALIIVGNLVSGGGPSWVGIVVALFLIFGTLFAYPTLFETFMHGKTPGKAAMGIEVVTVEGGPISFRHAAIRSALAVPEVFMTSGALAGVVVFFSGRQQRIGDMLAGTLVLRQRSGTTAPAATRFVPIPGTEDFVSTIDVSGMTIQEYQTIRTFLLRANSITPSSRDALCMQLAQQMVTRLRVMPPGWMTPMQFLVGVAAAYQARFQ